jgi:hypothetical protein
MPLTEVEPDGVVDVPPEVELDAVVVESSEEVVIVRVL